MCVDDVSCPTVTCTQHEKNVRLCDAQEVCCLHLPSRARHSLMSKTRNVLKKTNTYVQDSCKWVDGSERQYLPLFPPLLILQNPTPIPRKSPSQRHQKSWPQASDHTKRARKRKPGSQNKARERKTTKRINQESVFGECNSNCVCERASQTIERHIRLSTDVPVDVEWESLVQAA